MIELPSFTFIPGWLYIPLFDWIILLLVLTAVVKCYDGTVYKWNASSRTRFWGGVLVCVLILYIGLRPTTSVEEYGIFADTFPYRDSIRSLQLLNLNSWLDAHPFSKGEWLYSSIEAISAVYADEHLAFLICACFYVGCAAKFCEREFGHQWLLPFLFFCAAFSFFAYGVNGVRNGMAASLVILAFSYRDKVWIAVLLCVLALGTHKSMILLIVSALLAWKVSNPKLHIAAWIFCILLTASLGSTISTFIASTGLIADERFAGYVMQGNKAAYAYYTGFRADFLLFSSLPIITGAYFIFKKKYQDKIFVWYYNIYLISNSFWVLMMHASYSNRFAQLSWFIMPLVCAYPWFKHKFWQHQQCAHLGRYILIFYAYTFLSHILLPTITFLL